MIEFTITCDGGSLDNQSKNRHGYGSFMIQIEGSPSTVRANRMDFGAGVTNNEAEYKALIAALEHICDAFAVAEGNLKAVKLKIRTDCQLIIGHLTQNWKIKAESLRPLAIKASAMLQQFDSFIFEKISGDEMKTILGH